LSELEEKFGISNQVKRLFRVLPFVSPSDWLPNSMQIAQELPLRSQKAKSELIVMPILIELRNKNEKYFTIYSGDSLNVDDRLKGECDFILPNDTGGFEVNLPVIQVVEAKKNDLETGIPQCAAQMIGAQKYDEKRGHKGLNVAYGCVTTGDDWLFMRIGDETGDKTEIDTKKYYLGNLPELLGVFQHIIAFFRQHEFH